MPDAVIETIDLRKRFGRVEALRGLNLNVPAGSICGFLGRNGSGKSTTMKLLLGMVRPDGGEGRVLGWPIDDPRASVEIRRRTGFVSEEKGLYSYLTVEQMIQFTRPFFPAWNRALEDRYRRLFELPAERKIKALSKGMRAKLALLLALARGAELLILDEPTDGLDPAANEEVLQALVAAAAEGVTVFVASHRLAEIEQIADCVRILHDGRIVLAATLDELKENYRRIQLVFAGAAPAVTVTLAGMVEVRHEGRAVSVLVSARAEAIADELQRFQPISTELLPVGLKEIFLENVKRP